MGIVVAAAAGRVVRIVRRILLPIFVLVVVVLGYLVVTFVQVWLTSRHSDPHRAQAVVVMGAAQYDGVPSPDLRARLEEADGLFRQGLAPLVVVTGSKEPGDEFTEAEASKTWLVGRGVPAHAIAEVGGADSWENLAEAAQLLHRMGLRHVLVVTDGFHEDRSLAIATDVGLSAAPVPASASPITGWSTVPYFAKETVGVAAGRIVGYERLHRLGARVTGGRGLPGPLGYRLS